MRIAVLTSEFPSASETFVLSQVGDLLERGHEVDVYPERLPVGGPVAHPQLERHDLLARSHFPPQMPARRVARALGAARLLFAEGAPNASSLLRSLNPLVYGRAATSFSLVFRQVPFLRSRPYDVVHCHHGPIGLAGVHLRRLGILRGKLVATFHGHDANVVPRLRGERVYEPLFRSADLLTANSEFLCSRLRALGAPEDRLFRLPVGVDLAEFACRANPARSGAEIRLLSVGRLVEEKGIEFALRAVARLSPRFPALRYAVVGDGPLRGRLEALARELGVAERVRFLGALPHDRVREHYAAAHLFALPSVVATNGAQEAQGLALLEAQASGLPVVASAIGGIPESLRDRISGHLVPQGDVPALADRLAELIDRPAVRAAMGRAGRAFVERHFDRRALGDRLVALYAELGSAEAGRRSGADGASARRSAGSISRSYADADLREATGI